jgi:hypothetical protein
MEPGVPPIGGQEEKDFGSTFGGLGISEAQRRQMYLDRPGGMVSYHNDRERPGENLEEFRSRVRAGLSFATALLRRGNGLRHAGETFFWRMEAKLNRLLTGYSHRAGARHDSSFPQRTEMELPAEVGLDYLYFNRDMLAGRESGSLITKACLPSREDQASLIELLRDCARLRDPLTFLGSDHAPHSLAAKSFRDNGLPGSPERGIGAHHQIHMHLIHERGFTHADIDWLRRSFPLDISLIPFFSLSSRNNAGGGDGQFGRIRSQRILHGGRTEPTVPIARSSVSYAYRDEALRGRVWFYRRDGLVYDVRCGLKPSMGISPAPSMENIR